MSTSGDLLREKRFELKTHVEVWQLSVAEAEAGIKSCRKRIEMCQAQLDELAKDIVVLEGPDAQLWPSVKLPDPESLADPEAWRKVPWSLPG